jgi:hypothetical protein
VDQTTVDQVIPGTNGSGQALTYGELYFSAGGAVTAGTKNVMLCAEVYDGRSGVQLSAQFSGTNTAGPVSGAYDSAPQSYLTAGTGKFYTLSFDFSGIAFAKGGAGVGKENGGADFRITMVPLTSAGLDFKRVWLVTQGVPTEASAAAAPAATPLAAAAPSHPTGTLAPAN